MINLSLIVLGFAVARYLRRQLSRDTTLGTACDVDLCGQPAGAGTSGARLATAGTAITVHVIVRARKHICRCHVSNGIGADCGARRARPACGPSHHERRRSDAASALDRRARRESVRARYRAVSAPLDHPLPARATGQWVS